MASAPEFHVSGVVRGACPGLYDPMPSGDGLLARVRPPRARVSATQAIALGRLAHEAGNGMIEITSRGNLQFRGLVPETYRAFVTAVVALDLADPDPHVEGRLRIITPPLITSRHSGSVNTVRRLEALERALGKDETLALPAKFVFRLDGGPIAIDAIEADIAILEDGVTIALHDLAASVPAAAVIETAVALARIFVSTGARRMRTLDRRAIVAMFRSVGLEPSERRTSPATSGPIGRFDTGASNAVAFLPPFGALVPGMLSRLGTLASEQADGILHVTPFRSLIIENPSAACLGELHRLGLVLDPSDGRARTRACVGAPACASAQAPARAVAEHFLDRLPADGILHVSGCPKGCAHPGVAAISITGSVDGYRIFHHARADGRRT